MKPLAFVDLEALHVELGAELEEAVLGVIRRQHFVGGAEIAAFERAFADYLGVTHVIGLANGTDAIELALRALEIGAGDEVLVPANTFIATAEAVVAAGAIPRFVDVEEDSGLIDLNACAEAVGPRTRAIIPVHLYGRMVDMRAVTAFAERHGLVVVEDAAQAHGARRDGRTAGTVGQIGCFSFYPGKNLGAFGDAGAVATNDAELADHLRLLGDHGRRGRHVHEIIGVNSRLDPIHAAVLTAKLPHLDRWNDARRRAAEHYRSALPGDVLDWRAKSAHAEVHHLFPILVHDRDGLAAHLHKRGIQTSVHYRQAITTTAAFAAYATPCPAAERRAVRQLSLPLHPYLVGDDVERVCDAIREFQPVAMEAP